RALKPSVDYPPSRVTTQGIPGSDLQYLQRARTSAHQPLLHCGTRAFLSSHTSFLHSRTKPPRTHSPFRANSPIQKPKLFHAALQNPRPAFDGRAAALFTEIAALT